MTPPDKDLDQMQSGNLMPLRPSLKRFMIWSVVIFALVLFAGMWLFSGLSRTLDSIFPTTSDASTSLEPYEIALRSRQLNYKQLPDDVAPVEWIIKLPRAFVVKEFGSNGVASDAGKEGTYYSVNIHGVASKDRKTAEPAMLVYNKAVEKDFIGIKLHNSSNEPEIRKNNLCITQVDLSVMTATTNGTDEPYIPKLCGKGNPRCLIETHYQGWGMRILVAQDSEWYRKPVQACTFAKDFLKQHTIKIDALHTK